MRSSLLMLTALLLVAPVFAGCLGVGGEDASSNSGLNETQSKATISQGTGGIEGLVTDAAVQAVANVTITIEELGESTTTTTDGSFAFSEVTPGTYTLRFEKDGFITAERDIDVVSGQVSTLELIIAHKPTLQPYMQELKLEGFVECSVSTPAVAWATCSTVGGAPTIVGGGSATNDKFSFTHPVEANPWQYVTELTWEPTQQTASRMSIDVNPEGLFNDAKVEYAAGVGESPLIFYTDRKRIAQVMVNATAVCNGEKSTTALGAAQDTYCNKNVVEKGGGIFMRVFVQNQQTQGVGTAGAAFQQPYTIYQSLFYNAPAACEDYSIVNDNRCPQMEEPPEVDPYEEIFGNFTLNNSSGNGSG